MVSTLTVLSITVAWKGKVQRKVWFMEDKAGIDQHEGEHRTLRTP